MWRASLVALVALPYCGAIADAQTTISVLRDRDHVEGAEVVVLTTDHPPRYVPDDLRRFTDKRGEVTVDLAKVIDVVELKIVATFKKDAKSPQETAIVRIRMEGGEWQRRVEVKIEPQDGY